MKLWFQKDYKIRKTKRNTKNFREKEKKRHVAYIYPITSK